MAPAALSRYGSTARMAARSYVGDSPLFLLDYLLRFLRVAVLLAVWRSVLAGKGVVSGMTLGDVLTYTLIAEAFAPQLALSTGVEGALWEGSIATRMLRPCSLAGGYAAELVGQWAPPFALVSLPLLALAPLLGVSPLPASAAALGLFVVSLALAIVAGIAIDFLFAMLIVWQGIGVWTMWSIRGAVSTLLTGAVIPLALLPWGVGRVFDWLPFAATASMPLRIYTGTGPAAPMLAAQAAWCVVLWWALGKAWGALREKVACYGG